MNRNADKDGTELKKEAVFGLAYFLGYLGYLFVNQESESMHWLTLVIVPLILVSVRQRKKLTLSSVQASLATVGLQRDNLKTGIVWAILLGLALSVLQLFLSRSSDKIWQLIVSGKAMVLFPLVLVLMLLTAGFTEEFFFRGILQTRLAKLLHSTFWAVVVTSVLFGVYHLPYAYLNPNWPSQHDWEAAFSAALGQGIPAGLIFGFIYARTRNNLVACIVVHSLNNVLPAMTMVK
ncbi:MAG: lysostaphin resistance A-like protein [bacterium]